MSNSFSIGDRVRWFRSEAEVLRWLEQVELKYCEFFRLVSSLERVSRYWMDVATNQTLDQGFSAYSLRQAALFKALLSNAIAEFETYSTRDVIGEEIDYTTVTYRGLMEKLAKHRDLFLRENGLREPCASDR